jgi:hypothetical protein
MIEHRVILGILIVEPSMVDGDRGHLAEELRNPLAREIWERIEEEASAYAQTVA